MKKIISILICLLLAILTPVLASCNIISQLQDAAVKYPESYSLSYEVTSAEGTIFTVTKTIDENGNVYYRNADKETLYILDGSGYGRRRTVCRRTWQHQQNYFE